MRLSKLSPASSSVPPENNNNVSALDFSHKSAGPCLPPSSPSLHIHLFSSVRQHWEPGQPRKSRPFYLNTIFQKSCGRGSYQLCSSSALSSRKASVNEISGLTDATIFQKGDGIIFNVQETISQRII